MRRSALLLCIPSFVAAQEGKPLWVSHLPQDHGRIYALGMAPIAPTEAMAIRQAGNQARGEVLARLRANVKATTETRQTYQETKGTNQKATGTGTRTYDQSTSIQSQAADLPGLTVAQTWTDRKENTVYALAYLDVAVAERELRTRFEALQNDLAGESASGNPRERLRKLQRLKNGQVEAAKLDDIAGLIGAGGGDAALRADVRKVKLWMDKLLDDLKASLCFSVSGLKREGFDSRVGDTVRDAVLKTGLGWSERDPEFTIRLTLHLDFKSYDGILTASGTLDATLVDAHGTEYEQAVIQAKGNGITHAQAEEVLLRDYRAKIGAALEKWLKELTK